MEPVSSAPAREAVASAPTCAWCGAAAHPQGARLVVCEACGSATTFPAPDDAELAAAYADWYRPGVGRFSGPGDWLLRRSRATLARRVDQTGPPGPVLDVGCGDGVLLDALAARGREAVGLERESSRPDVRTCELSAFAERPGEWAAVVLWHSLEHLRDPAEAIDRAAELLAPGGLLVVAVPNRASLQARCFGDRWFALDLPRHLVHLSARGLVDGLERRGLALERVSFWRGGQIVFGWLHGLVGSLVPGHPDLYDAIRQPAAQQVRIAGGRRAATVAAGTALLPVAAGLAGAEILARAGGTVCVEARRPG
jgi:SAM-dependent methyltransferase